MDEQQYGAIPRVMAEIDTRRGVVTKWFLGLLAAAGVAGFELSDATQAGKRRKKRRRRRRRCKNGTSRCNRDCVNLNTDPRNCGRCGNACPPGGLCGNGVCGCQGLTICGNVCVDTATDRANCGQCGRACLPGEQCRNGVCGCDVCTDPRECAFQRVQDAIDAASEGAVISICPGTYEGTIGIGKDLSLIGAGADDTRLVTSDNESLASVRANVIVTIEGVTLSGGRGSLDDEGIRRGGGILNSGILTLTGVAVTDNRANLGAGVYNQGQARLTLDGVTIRRNEAIRPDGGASEGGGIYNFPGARLTITNGSIISQNTADNGGGLSNGSELTIRDSAISDNIATVDGGGMVNVPGSNSTLRNVVVAGNTTLSGRGGGIFLLGGPVRLENGTEIRSNTAGTDGGGIYLERFGTVISADSIIADNQATADGGGVAVFGGHLTLTRTPVRGNVSGGNGGGVSLVGDTGGSVPGSVTLQSTVISTNQASDGGGIFNTEDGDVTLDAQSRVVTNQPNNCVGTDVCAS